MIRDEKAAGIILEKSGKSVDADAVVIATGGLSYPSTGSTGDGYRFAKEAGHNGDTSVTGTCSVCMRRR